MKSVAENVQHLREKTKKLKERIAKYDNGTYESAIMSDHLRQISQLTWENTRLENEQDRYKTNWQNQVSIAENFRVIAFDAERKKNEMKFELDYYRAKSEDLESGINVILGESASHDRDLQVQVAALTEALLKEKARANNDGTNSDTPTSQTPYNKKKIIPNSRVKSNKNKMPSLDTKSIRYRLYLLMKSQILSHMNYPNAQTVVQRTLFLSKKGTRMTLIIKQF